MSEKFDFSKIEDQQKYDKLSEENQIDIVSEAQEEAAIIQKPAGDNPTAEKYSEVQEEATKYVDGITVPEKKRKEEAVYGRD